MIKPSLFKKIERVLGPEIQVLQDNIIVPSNRNNVYDVFNRYELHKTANGAEVRLKRGDTIHTFSSVKSALSWCIAERYQQSNLAKTILETDQQMFRYECDVAVSGGILSKVKDTSRKETLKLKHEHKCELLKDAKIRLEKCTNLAKYWQIRGFSNEIERTGRNAPNRSNRTSTRKSSRS